MTLWVDMLVSLFLARFLPCVWCHKKHDRERNTNVYPNTIDSAVLGSTEHCDRVLYRSRAVWKLLRGYRRRHLLRSRPVLLEAVPLSTV